MDTVCFLGAGGRTHMGGRGRQPRRRRGYRHFLAGEWSGDFPCAQNAPESCRGTPCKWPNCNLTDWPGFTPEGDWQAARRIGHDVVGKIPAATGDVNLLEVMYEDHAVDRSFRAILPGGYVVPATGPRLDGVVVGGWLVGDRSTPNSDRCRAIQCSPTLQAGRVSTARCELCGVHPDNVELRARGLR